jgi:hypothetical protein
MDEHCESVEKVISKKTPSYQRESCKLRSSVSMMEQMAVERMSSVLRRRARPDLRT